MNYVVFLNSTLWACCTNMIHWRTSDFKVICYFDFNYPASEKPNRAGSSYLCTELKLRRWDWLRQTGCRLPVCGPSSDPSPHRWALCPFKTSRATHHPGLPQCSLPQHRGPRTGLPDGERIWDGPEGQHLAQQQETFSQVPGKHR